MVSSLRGKRILVVEDEYFIASDLARLLLQQEAVVLGPVADVERGLALTEGNPIDAAILDVNLEGSPCFPIADRLSERKVPFMFLTGYDAWAIPPGYRATTRITKPFPIEKVLESLTQLVGMEQAS